MYLTSSVIMKPGGFTGSAGTPNYLQSLDQYVYNVQWTESQIGGLQTATLKCKIAYENVMDIQAGNWVAFGCYGGSTAALSSGATSIVVNNCTRLVNGIAVQDIVAGDSILVFDGVNAEIFSAASVSYSGSTATITLGSAQSQNTSHLLNSYPSGANVTKLRWQGIITARKRTTDQANNFDIIVSGMYWRYSKVIGDFDLGNPPQDSASAIYRVASMYTPQVPEIIVSPGNFLASNGIMYSGTAKNATLASFFSDILKTESGGAVPSTPYEATYWAMWVDELRQLHHEEVPTQNSSNPTITLDLVNPNTNGDVLGPVQPQDMDMSKLLNCVMVEGGKDGNGNVIDIVVTVQPSYKQWGYYEGYLSNPNINDKTALATWAAGQVGVLAWPQQTGKFDFVTTSARMSSRDLLKITGFTDSTTLVTNPTSIQYTADMKMQNVTGSVSITQQQPSYASIAREIANEKSIRQREVQTQTSVNQTYIVSGCELTTSGLTWNTTAGVVCFNGVLYSVPATTGTMPANDVIRLGIQVGGTAESFYLVTESGDPITTESGSQFTTGVGATLPAIVQMPSFNGSGDMSRLSGHDWFELA